MNKLQSLFYFFFPPTDRIWPDGASYAYREDGKLKVLHKHYTLRNLFVHWISNLFGNTQSHREWWTPRIGYEPRFGWSVGAIAYDNATSVGGTSGSTITLSKTNTGSNLGLIGGAHIFDTATTANTMTYNTVSMTLVAGQAGSPNDAARAYAFKLTNPATGANNLVVTLSSASADSTVLSAISFTGVDQTNCVEANAKNTDTSGNPTVNVTTLTNNAWVVDITTARRQTAGATTGAGQTERIDRLFAYSGFSGSALVSTEPKTTAGSVTMSWTISQSQNWAAIAVVVKAYVAPSSTDKFFLMF